MGIEIFAILEMHSASFLGTAIAPTNPHVPTRDIPTHHPTRVSLQPYHVSPPSLSQSPPVRDILISAPPSLSSQHCLHSRYHIAQALWRLNADADAGNKGAGMHAGSRVGSGVIEVLEGDFCAGGRYVVRVVQRGLWIGVFVFGDM
jgi:hypothetical protein